MDNRKEQPPNSLPTGCSRSQRQIRQGANSSFSGKLQAKGSNKANKRLLVLVFLLQLPGGLVVLIAASCRSGQVCNSPPRTHLAQLLPFEGRFAHHLHSSVVGTSQSQDAKTCFPCQQRCASADRPPSPLGSLASSRPGSACSDGPMALELASIARASPKPNPHLHHSACANLLTCLSAEAVFQMQWKTVENDQFVTQRLCSKHLVHKNSAQGPVRHRAASLAPFAPPQHPARTGQVPWWGGRSGRPPEASLGAAETSQGATEVS